MIPDRALATGVAILLLLFSCGCDGIGSLLTQGEDRSPSTHAPGPSAAPGDEYPSARTAMVEEQLVSRGIDDERVIEAMLSVPRHLFVPGHFADRAYHDRSVPIGYGQPLSQPYVVALMSSTLRCEPGDSVLEIGTGSGYQAAVLAEMGLRVHTVEIINELSESATARLDDLGYESIQARTADGYEGWPEQAPFDCIIVTAAPDHVPQPLLDQLAPGGNLVIPIGIPGAMQTLWSFSRGDEGEITAEGIATVEFVPLTRSSG